MQSHAMPRDIIIVGAGIAGLACAISLSKELTTSTPDLKITVYDGAPGPSASGGAISLTPTAQNYLDKLGVLSELNRMGSDSGIEVDIIELFSLRSGRRLGPLRFTDENGLGYGGYKGRRVMRSALSRAMLAVLRNNHPNVTVHYDKKVVGGTTADPTSVTLTFDDASTATADLVLGCDGVHSITRTRLVDPGNRSEYTGIAFIQSVTDANALPISMHFKQTAVHLTRHSSLLTSYCDPDRSKIFSAAILRVNEHLIERYQAAAKLDCREQASMKMSIRYLVRTQFAKSALPAIRELLDHTEDWALYPVYQVRQRGMWHKGRILLLGDAAHAMPPRDESAAYAIEDALIFTQILSQNRHAPLSAIFQEYETVRRELVNRAFDASRRLWQSDLDKGLFPGHVRGLMAPVHVSPSPPGMGMGMVVANANRGASAATHQSFSDLSVYSLTREFQGEIDS
ncbi:FAD/NAD(P)-binding domain-containing protein [Aspergillus heteromorphus CBS 117.55]|uniref:FAD/NAD(P)-binding domain-containing protein n=1 Tax=Aspergillus heteromorphus CBS 117.55 TaxID=1448321 RepID=A0A317W1V9_9EURO|nr:FAD/NAD(P)-binding domain-containing protein [Aspergillus heteromorphus CBS 117.55]PWY79252.1 FAD/NAD(P)-binding domain-containing protein [Aspergillus heteromorphus CBS 117.55]